MSNSKKITAEELKELPGIKALNDDELEMVTGGFNRFYYCDLWERKPGPFIIDDAEHCLDCKYRKEGRDGKDYCEKGRQ